MLSSCGGPTGNNRGPTGPRLFVVAFDGLDPRIVKSLMDAGKLPNFARLSRRGGFRELATSTPPHTPVAFSTIISGTDPGEHQIFDFIHRETDGDGRTGAVRPFFSTADTFSEPLQLGPLSLPSRVPLGPWQLPLERGATRLLRRGTAFWDYLAENGIDTDVYYVPSNYPTVAPQGVGRFRAISGMGTPDLLGSYGEFTFFGPERQESVGGGRFVKLPSGGRHRVETKLEGPPNFLRNTAGLRKTPMLAAKLTIVRDPHNRVAKISVSGSTVLLAEGEWSDWIVVQFPTGMPGSTPLAAVGAPTSVRGIVRMYLKQVHPGIELYVSPVNIDPVEPANAISSPVEFSQQLAGRHGRFYTLGIPEDNNALRHKALTEDEYISQCRLVEEERTAQYRQALADFQAGCLFFYFGTTDLMQHMFWRDRDAQHPGRDAEQAEKYGEVVTDTYLGTDRLVGDALDVMKPEDVLIVFSDHGFTTFRRGFNLNSWLLETGFIKLSSGSPSGNVETRFNMDWSKTTAYGIGMNALYLNMEGREKFGIVKRNAARSALQQLRDKLLTVRDEDGTAVIDRVDLVEDIYPGADPEIAPDMIIGYHDGYRASWATVLGDMPRDVIEDNLDRWSGTHLINPEQVPGMLLTSRPIDAEKPSIADLAPTILDVFGIPTPQRMSGQTFFASPSKRI